MVKRQRIDQMRNATSTLFNAREDIKIIPENVDGAAAKKKPFMRIASEYTP